MVRRHTPCLASSPHRAVSDDGSVEPEPVYSHSVHPFAVAAAARQHTSGVPSHSAQQQHHLHQAQHQSQQQLPTPQQLPYWQ
jgi:hypothetical protein